jgi:sarcosine oxidase subunit alpha
VSGYRLPSGGSAIDRSRPVSFTFDGQTLTGFLGDTLASALLANGVSIVGRSVHLDRPRGIFGIGSEEPNALVSVGAASAPELARATQTDLVEGLEARSLRGIGPVPAGGEDRADHRHAHCEVLVVGGGWAGVEAARAASESGNRRVILVDEGPKVRGDPAAVAAVTTAPETTILTRATAVGRYDDNLVLVVQRMPPGSPTRERLWHVRAQRVVIATGAFERPLVFRNNDRPGVMLAGAAATYVERFGVAPGRGVVVFTNNDSAYHAALALRAAGVEVPAIVDVRAEGAGRYMRDRAALAGIEVRSGHVIVDTDGEGALTAVTIVARDAAGVPERIACDGLAVSGGWNPALQLYTYPGDRLGWDAGIAAFTAASPVKNVESVGRANGDGLDVGRIEPLWAVPPAGHDDGSLHFVDLQRDATLAALRDAVDRGLDYPEHVKRWTTIGTGNDQGRTSAVNEVGILSDLTGGSLASLAPTAFRPPVVPVSFSTMAGRYRGDLYDPIRPTPAHPSHVALGALFENVGQWKRAWAYPTAGESFEDAVLRECRAVREAVGMMDVSTLGKIDVQGSDAARFLDRVYTNAFSTLKVDHARYGLMCRADGMVLDDGTTTRLADDRFFMTTTTGGAAAVLDWLEEWSQTEWPEMDVRFVSVTDQWAAVAIAGPRSRDVLARIAPDLDVSAESFPFLTFRETTVGGVAARVFRISFSGELAYEVYVPSWYGRALWDGIRAAGGDFGITPYGTEAMHVLRAEKGYVIVGQETDGTVTPLDLGLDWMVSRRKWFIGTRSLRRPAMLAPDRRQLVGLLPHDPYDLLPEGAPLPAAANGIGTAGVVGHVTSSYRSAALGRTFALALLAGGRARVGSDAVVDVEGRSVPAAVTAPVLYDPENLRRDG